MTPENKNGEVCPAHQCPPYACPADCPNKQKGPDSGSLKKEKYFSKEEVVKEIAQIAQADGFESGDLQPEPGQEKYDSEGKLLSFTVQVTQDRAREKKCGNIWYIYMVKGNHGPIGLTNTTCIMKADSNIETPTVVDFASVVSEYIDAEDKWVKQ
jgi:hypothetical protein